MSITNWPHADRPREKLLHKGEQTLTDAELIAIIFNTGIRGATALDIAKELLTVYGGLKKLIRTPLASLRNKKGVGEAKYAVLRAAIELGRRYLQENISRGTVLNNAVVTENFLAASLREYANEVFACLFLDNHYQLLSYDELFHGTINEANIYPREIVRRGLAHNAAKIILAHNHPSGNAEPSDSDKEVTLQIQKALELVDIEVIDHIIIGNQRNFSFAQNGLL